MYTGGYVFPGHSVVLQCRPKCRLTPFLDPVSLTFDFFGPQEHTDSYVQ